MEQHMVLAQAPPLEQEQALHHSNIDQPTECAPAMGLHQSVLSAAACAGCPSSSSSSHVNLV